MAEQSAVEQPLNPVEQPLKPEEPRPNVDYDPQAIDRRGQVCESSRLGVRVFTSLNINSFLLIDPCSM